MCVCIHMYLQIFLIAQLVKNLPAVQETLVQFLGGKICWRRDRLPTPVFLGFLCGSAGKKKKKNACSAGDLGLIPGLGRSLGEGKGYPFQFSGLENSMDFIVHRVTKSQTWLTFTFHFHKYLNMYLTFEYCLKFIIPLKSCTILLNKYLI